LDSPDSGFGHTGFRIRCQVRFLPGNKSRRKDTGDCDEQHDADLAQNVADIRHFFVASSLSIKINAQKDKAFSILQNTGA